MPGESSFDLRRRARDGLKLAETLPPGQNREELRNLSKAIQLLAAHKERKLFAASLAKTEPDPA